MDQTLALPASTVLPSHLALEQSVDLAPHPILLAIIAIFSHSRAAGLGLPFVHAVCRALDGPADGADCERADCAAHEAVAYVRSPKVPLKLGVYTRFVFRWLNA